MDVPTNKNLEALAGIRQINAQKRDGHQFDFKVETEGGHVLLHIEGKPSLGFPGVILKLNSRTASSLGISLLAMADKTGYHY